MDLKKLLELWKTYDAYIKELEDKEKAAESEIKNLTKTIDEIEKKVKDFRIFKETIWESSLAINARKIYEEIYEELKKVDAYGVYNIKEISEVLCSLALDITGVLFEAKVELDRKGFSCINNHGISYYQEVLYLRVSPSYNGICPSWNFRFCTAEGPSETDDISYCSDGYGGYGTCSDRKIREREELITYNLAKKSFENMNERETPDFISDFLSYVSNYRLEHDLKDISLEELHMLEKEFFSKYKDKYESYAQEKIEAERNQKEIEDMKAYMKKKNQSYAILYNPVYIRKRRRY